MGAPVAVRVKGAEGAAQPLALDAGRGGITLVPGRTRVRPSQRKLRTLSADPRLTGRAPTGPVAAKGGDGGTRRGALARRRMTGRT